MKMTQQHYEALKKKVGPLLPKIPEYRESLRGDPKVKDLDTRVLWDVFHASRIRNDYSYQEFDYNDAHIETAMRAVFRDLKIPLDSDVKDAKSLTKESFNAALNAAKVDVTTGTNRKVRIQFNVGKMKLEVEVTVAPKELAKCYGYSGVNFGIVHKKSVCEGVYIHWDFFGKKEVDIGFEIERYDELVKLATRTKEELAQTLGEVKAAISGYNQEIGLYQESSATRPRM